MKKKKSVFNILLKKNYILQIMYYKILKKERKWIINFIKKNNRNLFC